MFIVIISDSIVRKTWPLVGEGRVCLFKTTRNAHEYMREKLGGCETPNEKPHLSGCGKYHHNELCRAGEYSIQEVKIIECKPEPEVDLDPYDGMTPADYGSDCP